MNGKERYLRAMAREPIDRPPFDLAATPMTQVQSPALEAELYALLGVKAAPRSDGRLDEAALRLLGADFRPVGGMLRPESPLARPEKNGRYTDMWGLEWTLSGGAYQITRHPLKGATLEEALAFPYPDAANADKSVIARFRDEAKRLYEDGEYAVVAEHPTLGVMELGLWMFGYDDFLLRMAGEPELVKAYFERIWRYQQDAIDLYYGALGEYIHVTTSGDDFGTQTGPFLSPRMFGELVAPYYDARIALTKCYTKADFFHHTCGSVYALIPRLIQAGVQVLNPMQPNARDMEPEKLRAAYGGQIAFWGGVDTQRVLPFGTRDEVRSHVRSLLSVFGREGGYVFAPAHNLQSDVPARNVAAMYEAAREFYEG